MPHQVWLVKICLDHLEQNRTLQDGCQSCAQPKPHDTRNGEDTKETLQVLFPCPIKRVAFIVDISNTVFLMKVHAPSGLSSKVEEKQQFQIIVKKDLQDPESRQEKDSCIRRRLLEREMKKNQLQIDKKVWHHRRLILFKYK